MFRYAVIVPTDELLAQLSSDSKVYTVVKFRLSSYPYTDLSSHAVEAQYELRKAHPQLEAIIIAIQAGKGHQPSFLVVIEDPAG